MCLPTFAEPVLAAGAVNLVQTLIKERMIVKEKKGGQFFELIKGDCLEKMQNIPDRSVDLVVIDPPYNIGKDKKWDKWETVEDYVIFIGECIFEITRVLKETGSFYFFHNDFLQMVEIQNMINKDTNLKFKQLIVWNQRFKEMQWVDKNNRKRNYTDYSAILKNNCLRNYKKMAEYCLFYTKQHEYFDTPFSRIMKKNMQRLNLSQKDISKLQLSKNGNITGWVHNKLKGIQIPTKKQWELICNLFEIDNKYCALVEEYNNERYTFNNLQTHHSVWNYVFAESNGHLTPKPVDLIENIIKYSSNENDLILDCFMGSGSTGVAAMNTKRNFIGIEKDDKYFDIAVSRIKGAEPNPNNFEKVEERGLFSFMDE